MDCPQQSPQEFTRRFHVPHSEGSRLAGPVFSAPVKWGGVSCMASRVCESKGSDAHAAVDSMGLEHYFSNGTDSVAQAEVFITAC